jgi:hypothetical protein
MEERFGIEGNVNILSHVVVAPLSIFGARLHALGHILNGALPVINQSPTAPGGGTLFTQRTPVI